MAEPVLVNMNEPIEVTTTDPELRKKLAEILGDADFNNCLTCGMCTAGCPYTDLIEGHDPRKFIRKVALGLTDELKKDPYIWICNMCERCTIECPMKVNIAALVRAIRGNIREDSPGFLQKVVDDTLRSGNQMDVSQEEFMETLEWIQDELREELGDPNYTIPLDKEDADFMFGFNAREVKYYPNDLQDILKIFYAAGANYTISTRKWDATNLALFSGRDEDFWNITRPLFEEVVRLRAKELIITECGHAFRSVRYAYRKFWKGPQFPIRHILQLLCDWVKEGRIKLDPDAITEPVTYHDPCNTARKEGVFEEPRIVLKSFIKDFRDMTPNRRWNYCCGGGGGALAMPEYTEYRLMKGKRKADQVKATGAKIVAVPCHNCMDQFNDITKHYKLGTKNKHVCALVAEALILPGKEEKEEKEE